MEIVTRVMVACVTTEVVKIVRPAELLKVDRVHLLSNIIRKDDTEENRNRATLYQEFRDTVFKELKDRNIEVIPHDDAPIFKLDACLLLLHDILLEETSKGSVVSINIEGPVIFVAAATMASMMFPRVTIFNVGVPADGKVDFDRDRYVHDDCLVGTAFKINDSLYQFEGFPMETPDEEMLKALKVFSSIPLKKRSNLTVIAKLSKYGLWKYADPNDADEISTLLANGERSHSPSTSFSKARNRGAVNYRRGYIEYWLDKGWIESADSSNRKYEITQKGRRLLNVFCSDIVLKIRED